MKTIFFSFQNYERPYYTSFSQFTFHPENLNTQTLPLAIGAEIISCFVNDRLDAEILEPLAENGLKMIALRCAGFNHVDLETARKLNIKVTRVPEYSPYAVAEHAVALLLTLNRKIHKAYNRVREGNFSIEGLTGFDIHGCTIGVVGTGKIGQIFCQILLGFGAKVLAFDPYPKTELENEHFQYCSLEMLWEKSDIISLHCPLTPDSIHLINDESIEKMKKGVFIINTSRGGLLDTRAAIRALKTGKISGLALDVYEEESGIFFYDHSGDLLQDDILARLMTFPNVLITSHQAFLTTTALENIATVTLESISAFIQKRDLAFQI